MKALTVKQPWANAIAHGSKRTENRTWPAPAKHLGTRVLIHAGAAYDPMGRFIIDRDDLDSWPDTRGAILAVATLASCHFDGDGCSENCTAWGQRQVFHWKFADVSQLAIPVPAKGALGFWAPGASVLAAIEAQLQAVAR